jgi:hypothetical protein
LWQYPAAIDGQSAGFPSNQEDFMTDKIRSISAKEISGEVEIAVRKALAANEAFKGVKVESKFVMTPWLIGFILRELELQNKTIGDVGALAGEVVRSMPLVKGNQPATLIHDGRIICGYIQRELMEF